MLKIYNTLNRELQVFKPARMENVKVYFCWPTVYNYAHIWNLRTFVFEDAVIKTLKFLWYWVTTLMNLTDIDDKTIRDSQKVNEKLKEFTERYTKIFLDDIEKIWITKADSVVPISNRIKEMVLMINIMLKKWYAYIWDDSSIYYDISKFKDYWKLANLDFSWLKANARVNNDEYEKENLADFVLWKAWKEDDWENYWEEEFEISNDSHIELDSGSILHVNWNKKCLKDSEINSEWQILKPNDYSLITIKWRPGWHIECSACNMAHFWLQIDIHMWWVDLIFPHHQNEIAQTEAVTWKQFSRYWLHSWHLMVDWKKMSKSLWNFYTLKDLEEKYSEKIENQVLYRAFRLWFINWKYRDSIDFSFTKLEQNFSVIERIDETIKKLFFIKDKLKSEKWTSFQKSWVLRVSWIRREFRESIQEYIVKFMENLEDDFNFVEALASFFSFLTFVNKEIENITREEYNAIIDMFKTYNQIFWIIKFDFETSKIPEIILKKLDDRNIAKKDKNFMLADALRDELENLGYKILDSREWTRLEKIGK